jgi:predicted RNase H-like HicB family nuclease
MERTYTVVVTRDPEDGCYVVTVPALDDCSTYGDTLPEVLERAHEAILAYLEGLATLGKDAPPDLDSVAVSLGASPEASVYRVAVREEAAVA